MENEYKLLKDQIPNLDFYNCENIVGKDDKATKDARNACNWGEKSHPSLPGVGGFGEGGFYSAEDADSEGEEGKFYVWNITELETILGKEDADLFREAFNLKPGGNWNEGYRHKTNIPHLTKDFETLSKQMNINKEELTSRLDGIIVKLFKVREKRIHPQKDDKILTDWNGMMISAFARAARVLNNDDYGSYAIRAMNFIMDNLKQKDGKLLKRYRNGNAGLDGVLDDYAYVIWGLLELYQYNFDINYLKNAILFSDYQIKHFWDNKNGGFYFNSDISEQLLIRSKEIYDGAIPSGNSVSANNFIKLGRILSRTDYEDISNNLIESFGKKINRYGPAYSKNLMAIDFIQGPSYEIVIIGNNSKNIDLVLKELNSFKHDRKVIIKVNDSNRNELIKIIPFIDNFPAHTDSKPWIYVCKNFSCDLPTQDIEKVKELLTK